MTPSKNYNNQVVYLKVLYVYILVHSKSKLSKLTELATSEM